MTTPLLTIPADSEDEWKSFLLYHALDHDRISQALRDRGLLINKFLLTDARGKDDSDWHNDHYAEHQEIYDVLGLTGLPDLASGKLDENDQFMAWQDLHNDVHTLLNLTLGI
jgi:hypothetical protein